jgi:hypothetical protein
MLEADSVTMTVGVIFATVTDTEAEAGLYVEALVASGV